MQKYKVNTNKKLQEEIAERRLLEKRVRESEKKYRKLIEIANVAIFVVDIETGTIREANKHVEALLGIPADEIIGMHYTKVHPVGKEKRYKDLFEKYTKIDKLITSEDIFVQHKDGRKIPVEISTSVFELGGKKVIQGIFRDITERKRLEKALQESEKQKRQFLNSLKEGVYQCGPGVEGVFTLINQAGAEMFGYKSAEEMIGTKVEDIYVDLEDSRKLVEKLEKDGVWMNFVSFCKKKNGDCFYTERTSNMVKDARGKPVRIEGIIRDITERKRCEDQLHKLSSAVEQSPATVIITDTKGNIEYVNPKFTQLTGYTLEETIEQNPRILKSGKTSPDKYKKLWETITSGREWSGEFCDKKKNGELYWESASISPIKNAEGVITDFVCIKKGYAQREKVEKRLKARYLVTRALVEAITIKEAFSKILETICTTLEWDIGEIWIVDQQENVLRNAEIWHIPSFKIPEFKAVTRQITFPLQIGLPGKVWECAGPLWIEDVVRDTNFSRASVTAKESVRGAFGFPILNDSKVIGTINFFSQELKHHDKYLLDMMSAIGMQIGLFIKRKRAEELLHVQKKGLEQKNIALHEVLGQIELEKKQIKDNVVTNVEILLLPIIQKLRLKGEPRKYVQLLQKNLHELTSSFGTRLTETRGRLTFREIEICDMIKKGLTSKEIASLINISFLTIEKHRINIRRKLGIINKDINLASFLKNILT